MSDGIFASERLFARCGMVVGCSFATTFVKIFYMREFDALAVRHPRVSFEVYIDDVTAMSANKCPRKIVEDMGAFDDDFCSLVAGDLQAKIADNKTVVVADSKELAGALAKRLGCETGEAVQANATNLGVDFVAGQGRQRQTHRKRSKRIKEGKARKRRGTRLWKGAREAPKRIAKLFSCGLGPIMAWGSEIDGLDDSELRSIDQTAAAFLKPCAGAGPSRQFCSCMVGLPGGRVSHQRLGGQKKCGTRRPPGTTKSEGQCRPRSW